jgi:hypothetical protein
VSWCRWAPLLVYIATPVANLVFRNVNKVHHMIHFVFFPPSYSTRNYKQSRQHLSDCDLSPCRGYLSKEKCSQIDEVTHVNDDIKILTTSSSNIICAIQTPKKVSISYFIIHLSFEVEPVHLRVNNFPLSLVVPQYYPHG